MDLEEAADELYGGSPDDFVERRTALVAAARQERERELAKQIGALRRPTRTAWLVNLLARESPGEVTALLELGDALADAQRRSSGSDLRRLSADRRRLVDRLGREAVTLGAAHGYRAPDAALQEVSQTLQAGLGDPEVREQLRSGRLSAAVSYGGFGPSDLMGAMAASVLQAEPASEPAEAEIDAESDAARQAQADRAAEAEREAERQAEAERAAQAEREAEREAEAATAHADELATRLEELRAELRAAEAEEAEARDSARVARRHLQDLRRGRRHT